MVVYGSARTLRFHQLPCGTQLRVEVGVMNVSLRSLPPRCGVDAKGNLIYQGLRYVPRSPVSNLHGKTGVSWDSLPFVRANADTRRLDTIAAVAVATAMRVGLKVENGRAVTTIMTSPLSNVDDWVVLSDGTVIVVRGHDYHVEWIAPNGEIGAGGKLPFDWKRLSDEDKQQLVDSAKAERSKRAAELKAQFGDRLTSSPPAFTTPGSPPGSFSVLRTPPGAVVSSYALVEEDPPLSEIPDYWPPIRLNAAKRERLREVRTSGIEHGTLMP